MSDLQTLNKGAPGPITTGPYPELSHQAVIVGYFLGIVIALSIGYASLTLGFSIEGSELAAILGFGILRGILRRRSIVENNVTQTVASAVNGASSGIMFSVPAIFILNYNDMLNPYILSLGAIAGSILGIAFIIPLRKQMIDFERLTYPGGVAVATILKSPGAGIGKAKLLLGAFLFAVIAKIAIKMYTTGNIDVGSILNIPDDYGYLNLTFYASVMTIGVGYIAGRGGVAFIIGGFACYFLLSPLLDMTGNLPVDANGDVITNANSLRLTLFRPTGIGMLIGGALVGVMFAIPLIKSAITSMQSSAKVESAMSKDEMPIKLLYIAIAAAAVLLTVMAVGSAQEVGLKHGIMMGVLGTLWIWMAGIILSEAIGRTNWSPLSGMTLVAITILIFIVKDLGDGVAIVAAITVGAATCVAMSQAADLMLDMKTGYLVGATPRMQQWGQFLGAWIGPILMVGLIYLLAKTYGFSDGTEGSTGLPAPQANAIASVVKGILGGEVPMEKYMAGAALGGILSAMMGGLGITVGLGFYLPFNIVLTYSIGTLLREISDRKKGHSWSDNTGIPIAAGLIVGEALVGVGDAIIQILSK